ncbi:MAG: isochorismatase family protein [Terriglobus roseus]|nr:isochorismatase family protein [Terriglobus roseus]
MTVTVLDPITALILVDLQKGVGGLPTVHPATDVVRLAAELAKAARRNAMPVVLVNVAGGAPGRAERARNLDGLPADWTDFVPELDVQPTDLLLNMHSWGAFINTGLEAHFRALGVTQVLIAGIATTIGVESTARQAHELGFNVVLATDATADMSAEAHENSVMRIFPALGQTGHVRDIVSFLDL